MDIEKIKKLVEVIENSSLTEFAIEDGETKISMSKCMPQGQQVSIPAAPIERTKEKTEDEELFITSPIVGTFYSASAPDIPAFVRVGDIVRKGQTVCVLEAMKLMNEIECEYDCEIKAVLVSNEQKVEYGQPLFRVKKI